MQYTVYKKFLILAAFENKGMLVIECLYEFYLKPSMLRQCFDLLANRILVFL